jgi:hypothetical protein
MMFRAFLWLRFCAAWEVHTFHFHAPEITAGWHCDRSLAGVKNPIFKVTIR